MRKSLYYLVGMALLISTAIILAVFDEPSKENNPKTTEIKEIVELTGTPADNYEPHEREQHCGGSDAKSNKYIQEFEIPTPCTQPLSIVTDSDGNVWFTQTNTGNIAMFNPESKQFIEYQNNKWNLNTASMMWGIAYTEDKEIWFTDNKNGAIWKFSIPEKTYSKFEIPGKEQKSFPQKIGFYNDNFIINDFTGNQVVILNHEELDKGKMTYSSISVPEGFFTSQALMDDKGNIWFVMWKYQKETILVKTNSMTQKTEQFVFPTSISAPNGVSIGPLGNVWIADTAGDSFYKFVPESKRIVEFVTSKPPIWTYGNSSGLIKTPITRPYWNAFDSDGNMWFNQQTGNRLAVFDPSSESLIEYDIPSKNPSWSDCGDLSDCGLSQSFGFTFQDDQVWFTEWVENNIGVLDTSVTIPILLETEKEDVPIKQGEQKEIFVTVTSKTDQNLDLLLSGNTNSELIKVKTSSKITPLSKEPMQIPVTILVDEEAHKGQYKVLLSTQLQDVSISSYVTIDVI